jgi:hypothetical protein
LGDCFIEVRARMAYEYDMLIVQNVL